MEKEKIARINALAKKKKETGLTPEEAEEQAELYKFYLAEFRAQFTATLENTTIQYPDGRREAVTDRKGKK